MSATMKSTETGKQYSVERLDSLKGEDVPTHFRAEYIDILSHGGPNRVYKVMNIGKHYRTYTGFVLLDAARVIIVDDRKSKTVEIPNLMLCLCKHYGCDTHSGALTEY